MQVYTLCFEMSYRNTTHNCIQLSCITQIKIPKTHSFVFKVSKAASVGSTSDGHTKKQESSYSTDAYILKRIRRKEPTFKLHKQNLIYYTKKEQICIYHYIKNKSELVDDAKVQEPLCDDESLQNYHDDG